MKEPNNNNQNQLVPPYYMQAQYDGDEINLVDLWITLKAYKKQFFIYFTIVFLLAIALLLTQYKTKYELISSLQIGSIKLEGSIRLIDSLEATKSKLINVFIPIITKQLVTERNLKKHFKTSVSSDKGSDVILLKNKVSDEDVLMFSDYQKKILSLIISDHDKKLKLTQTKNTRDLKNKELSLSQLKKPLTLEIRIKEQDIEIKNNKAGVKFLQEDYKLIKKSDFEGVLITLPAEELSRVMTKDNLLVSELLRVRYETFLLKNKQKQHDLLNLIDLNELSIIEIKKDHDEMIEKATLSVDEIKLRLENVNRSTILSEPIISIDPIGLSQNILFVLSVFAALFIAFIGILIAMFKDKVAQRVAELA